MPPTKHRIFVATPADVTPERDTVSFVVEELRTTIGDIRNIELQTVRWETHAWPDVGEDAQDVINSQIGEYDLFVGVMWKRFGTPTKRAGSGTGEEFERAYELFRKHGRPKIMFYFRTTPFYSTDLKELTQFKKVVSFRKKLEKLGVLFWTYSDPLTFERDLRAHLTRQILQLTESKYKHKPTSELRPPRIFISGAREDEALITPFYKALVAAGFEPWMDVHDLLPGEDWTAEIAKRVESSDFFLPFLSDASTSKAGYFQKERRLAINTLAARPGSNRYVIPVRLDPVEAPPELRQFQWLDLYLPNGAERLVATIREAWRSQASRRTSAS
jgi:TIR domain